VGQQPKARQARQPSRAYEQRAVPPVMVRGSAQGLPLPTRQTGQTKARRRYDVSLGMPGVEMQLPALPSIEISARLVAGVLTIALVALLTYFWNSPDYRVNELQINGLQRLNSRDVSAVLGLEGELIFNLDPLQVEQNLRESFPEFLSVSAKVNLPNEITIDVTERQPLLTWMQDGRTTLVDAGGVSFPLRDGNSVETQVTIEAVSAPPSAASLDEQLGLAPFMPVEMVTAILSMSAQAPAGTPLLYDARHGLGWHDAQGWDVYFGDVKDIEMKLRLYQAMVAQMKKEGMSPVLISVEYVHAPFYRMER